MQNARSFSFVFLEILFGLAGGIFYIYIQVDKLHDTLWNSIINAYLILNTIFAASTILIGTISAVVLRKTGRLFISILLSLLCGLVFLLIHATILPIGPFAFLSLFGFVMGFNWYLLKRKKVEIST